jgi:hypothetical protein
MYRILLTLFIACISFFANGQFKKGDILLGGNLSFNAAISSDSLTGNRASVNITVGKAVNESTLFGVSVLYQPYWSSYYFFGNNGTALDFYLQNSFAIGVFYRKYKSLGKDFFLFGEAGGNFGWSTQTGKDFNDVKVLTGSGINAIAYVVPGFAYRVSENFFLELSFNNLFYAQYSSSKTTIQSVDYNKDNQFTIGTSLSSGFFSNIGVGFRLVL